MRGSNACQSTINITTQKPVSTDNSVSKLFQLKMIFSEADIDQLAIKYGLKRMSCTELSQNLHAIFEEYIVLALSEQGGSKADRDASYNEAMWHLLKAQKLLKGQPHPAGKMSQKIGDMVASLISVLEGSDHGADRARRFVEKNLARKLKQLWQANTASPFIADLHFDGHSTVEFFLECFELAAKAYDEIEWFKQVTPNTASKLIRSVK